MSFDSRKRTADKATILVDIFYIGEAPVCCAWWGDETNERMMCMFYGARKFGCQPVCMFNGNDIHEIPNEVNRVPDFCPLHNSDT